MNDLEPLLKELREIKYHMSLLTFDLRTKAARRFSEDILRTDGRKRIWEAFDGERSPAEVGRVAGVTGQAVRDLIQDKSVARFLLVQTVGNALVGSRDLDAVMDWYLSTGTP